MFRGRFITALLLTLALATSFFYAQYQAQCPLPITYRIGEVDERFVLERAEAAAATAAAVTTWEDGTGQDAFALASSSSGADLTINFIFDDRQARTDAEARERERLSAVEQQSEEVQAAYQTQVEQLEARERAYEAAAAAYERDLARYNATVAEYNEEGGAPPEVFTELEAERERLDTEASRLNAEVDAINALIDDINELGAAGNSLISQFNDRVNDFNQTFADGREFTQGDYQDGRINIYSFADRNELHTVLVHELGHALNIEHVDDANAFMYYLLSEQQADAPLTVADRNAFTATCSTEARLAAVPQPWRQLFAWLGV